MKKNNAWKFYIVGILFLVVCGAGVGLYIDGRERPLVVAFLDVGQGDAIYIEAPNGNQILIDGGPDRGVLGELGNVMKFWDRSIDIVIGTHPDKDHIGGFVDVLENYRVDLYLDPGIEPETKIAQRLVDLLHVESVETFEARRGMRIHLDETSGVFLDILYPDHDVSQIGDRNEGSVVAVLRYGTTSFLFTGDAGVEVERDLTSEVANYIDVDILKLGHHGSNTSSSLDFLTATTPEIVVISAGRDNRYGHPHEEVMGRLEMLAIPFIGTYDNGAIKMKSDGKNIYLK